MYEAKITPSGLYEIYYNGQKIATTTQSGLSNYPINQPTSRPISQPTIQTLPTNLTSEQQARYNQLVSAGAPPSVALNAVQQIPTTQQSAPQIVQSQSTGDPVLDSVLATIQTYIDKLQQQGKVVNPYIEITPEKVAEFTAQVEREISPYYATQLKLAREGLLRTFGYTTEQLEEYERQLERKYGQQLRQLGEQMAEQGFALSGIRRREEEELAKDIQEDIESKRRALSYTAGTTAREFVKEWGVQQLPQITISETPRVLPGEQTFQRSNTQTPFYILSPETYEGLIGSKQWEEKAAKQSRLAQLESAWKESELAKRYRTLNL